MRNVEFETDLHLHSTYGDGLKTREQILIEAGQRGIKSLVFTEHSNILRQKETRVVAEREGIEILFPGVEIISIDSETRLKVHLLAFGKSLLSPGFMVWVTKGVTKREEFYRQVVHQAEESLGIKLPSFPDLLSAKPVEGVVLPYPYEPYRYLVSAKVIALHISRLTGLDTQKVLDDFVPRFVDDDIAELSTAIHRVGDEGGIVVLAHPLWILGTASKNWAIVRKAITLGVHGIEVRHPKHSKNDTQILYDLAKDGNLLVTGGSDYHGKEGEDKNLGNYGLTEKEKAAILNHLRI